MIAVKLVGATGYGGIGLIELLYRHPNMRLVGCAAVQDVGKPVSTVWPHLEGYCDMPILAVDSDEFRNLSADVTVFATPDGVGQSLVKQELAAGRRVLDYSGDFRFNSSDLYHEYATRIGKNPQHQTPELLSQSVYGLTELHRDAIKDAKIVGNPGCFAVSCILGWIPAIENSLVNMDSILICDCKSGVSGAGKKPSPGHHFPERQENLSAYRLSGHQHVMEIERELTLVNKNTNKDCKIVFTPQVCPMTRGIMSCLYGQLASGVTQKQVWDCYQERYANEPFVLLKSAADTVGTGNVRGSNRIILTIACDERAGVFRVISHIDNLLKGQAGSALQNLNVMFGFAETTALDCPASHP